jgi:hypothetical protein
MLAQLILVYCLAADPSRCIEQRPIVEEPGLGLVGCVVGAQPEAARWLATHPGYVLARYRCELGSRSTERST